MRFAVWPGPSGSVGDLISVVEHCDRSGWDGAYVMDHFMVDQPDAAPDDTPVPEALSLLGVLAGRTSSLRLGPLVLGNTYRHPAVVAKAAVTLDAATDGRFVLGLGAGWQANEHEAYGIDLPPVRTRLDRFEEATEAIASLVRNRRTTFAGRHYQLSDAPCEPTPPADRLPLLIGAKGPRRGLRIAARFADEWNSWATVDQLRERRAILERHCEDVGRDPADIAISTQAFVTIVDDPTEVVRRRSEPSSRPRLLGSPAEIIDQIGAYAEAGLDELIVPAWDDAPLPARLEVLDRVWTEIAPAFR